MKKKINNALLLLILLAIIFGQLPRLYIEYYIGFPVHILDALVAIFALVNLPAIFGKRKTRLFRVWFVFLGIAWIGFAASPHSGVFGFLHLLRFTAYTGFAAAVFKIGKSISIKKFIYDGLTAVSAFVAVLGLIQYRLLPDLRDLQYIGWDDHHFRLASTYLDPAFAGIIIVFGMLLVAEKLTRGFRWKWGIILAFEFVALLLTFSRSSMLALAAGTFVLTWQRGLAKYFIYTVLALVAGLAIVPKQTGEGVNLFRTYSVTAKIDNTKEALGIVRENSFLGVGFNNLCALRGGEISNSCSGADNVFAFAAATTGLVGLVVFVYLLYLFSGAINTPIFAALLVHAQFTNTFFYNFAMAYFILLLVVHAKR